MKEERKTESRKKNIEKHSQPRGGALCGVKPHFLSVGVMCL